MQWGNVGLGDGVWVGESEFRVAGVEGGGSEGRVKVLGAWE